MSDFAQLRLERFVGVFERLSSTDDFTKGEIQYAVKRIRYFEHKLHKATKTKRDITRYIQYLINLMELSQIRLTDARRLGVMRIVSEALRVRIINIFFLATNTFREDVSLWMSHIEFLTKQKHDESVGKVFGKMLHYHSNKPRLWILAAKFEFEKNGSPENARALLLRGIRFNPESKKLYKELFRFELLYVDKLKKRLEVLLEDAEKVDQCPEDINDAVYQCKLAEAVFMEATEIFLGDIELFSDMATIAREFSFSKDLADLIYNFVETNYLQCEARWLFVAERRLQEQPSQVDELYSILDEAMEKFNNGKIFRLYIEFCLKQLQEYPTDISKITSKALEVFEKAWNADDKCLDEQLVLKWVNMVEEDEKKIELLQKLLERFKKSEILWVKFLSVQIAIGSSAKKIMKYFNRAVQTVPEKRTLPLWHLALKWSMQTCPEKIEKLLEASLIYDVTVSSPLKIIFLEWIQANYSKKDAKVQIKRLCDAKPNSLEFYTALLNLVSAEVEPDAEFVRYGFEQALCEYHGVAAIWLQYSKFEMNSACGDPARASALYQRAINALGEEQLEEFIRDYIMLRG